MKPDGVDQKRPGKPGRHPLRGLQRRHGERRQQGRQPPVICWPDIGQDTGHGLARGNVMPWHRLDLDVHPDACRQQRVEHLLQRGYPLGGKAGVEPAAGIECLQLGQTNGGDAAAPPHRASQAVVMQHHGFAILREHDVELDP